ncbi:ubiquitin/ISG15-conjugating enzyme E2 L6 isoform X1 [Cygnus olor]|uniref:ubiquitin/ISG15-conjugating enzyme E2 L6 isoform X1 n=1 Tax=Cygnus olor TaxID=8869 RepID=UPI001ADEAB02|nr:ubiquitin/ISG15-conjugating enzyme E2 L6 isoform X1 [Cygnus olor]
MAMSRRLAVVGGGIGGGLELEEARQWRGVRDLHLLGGDVLCWRGLLLPNNPPYNTGAFRFELAFSPHHPLAPPHARLLTSIYHPGVDEDGHVCQPLTSPDHWQATTRAVHVLQDLLLLLDSPDTERVMRLGLARELSEQPEIFWRRAEEHTRGHAEPRPEPPGS